MCGSNPELSPEVNSAKCIGGTALGFAIVTLIGFAIVPWGLVSALAGLFGVIAGSIVCCCGPKAKGEGDGKMNAAGILFIIAAVFHFIAIILPIVGFLILSAAAAACYDQCDSTDFGGLRTMTSCPGTPDDPYGIQHLADCTSAAAGAAIIAIFAWPVMIFALVAMILEIVGAVKCMKAKAAIVAEGGGGPTVEGNKQ